MIAKMDRIEVVFVRDRLADVVRFVQAQGNVHVEEVPLAVENAPGYLHRVHLTPEQHAQLESLQELHRILREIAPLLSWRPDRTRIEAAAASLESGAEDAWHRKVRRWSRELRSVTRRKVNLEDNVVVLSNHRDTVKLIEGLLGGREIILGKNGSAFVLKGDVEAVHRTLHKRLQRELGPEAQFLDQRLSRNSVLGVVTYPENRNETARKILEEEGIELVDLPDKNLQGAAVPEILARLEKSIASHQEDLAAVKGELGEFSEEAGPELEAMKAMVADRLGQLKIVGCFAQSTMVGVIHGWIPSKDLPAFSKALQEFCPGEAHVNKLAMNHVDRNRIPILLTNPAPVKPFEVLLSMLKPPSYGTIDASALAGIFFLLFYGFILGDVIYGLAVIGFALLLRHYLGRHEVAKRASTVAICAGVSSMIFGVLFGEYCGDIGHRLFPNLLKPLWFPRHIETMRLLSIAVAIGAFHIVLSLVLAVWAHWRIGDRKHALEKLGALLGLLSIGAALAGLSGALPVEGRIVLAVAGALFTVAIVLLVKAAGAMVALHVLELISLVSNVLSYCRLMALGIASVALADVANEMARTAGSIWLAVPIFLVIHLLNIGLGMFSPTLHSLRLIYVEFLPKFYSPEGRSYTPFRKEALW